MKRFALLIALILALAFAPTNVKSTGASPASASAPQTLTGVLGTPLVFVVSTYTVGCNYEPCLRLQRTSDNGAHFTSLHLPPLAYISGDPLGNLNTLIFANAHDGYAFVNTPYHRMLYVTVDGARSWHRESVSAGFVVVHLVATEGELYALIAKCSKTEMCTDFRVARSPLTANRWTTSALPPGPSRSGLGVGAFGPNVWGSLQTTSAALLYTSHNQGRTFTQSSAPKLVSMNGCSLTASSAMALWAECPGGMLESLLYSGDAGADWTSIAGHEISGTGGGAFDPVSSSLAYIDYGNISGPRNLYRITNQGRRAIAVGNLACSNVTGLVFTDVMHGLAACDQNYSNASTHLLRTSNGGATWTKVSSY